MNDSLRFLRVLLPMAAAASLLACTRSDDRLIIRRGSAVGSDQSAMAGACVASSPAWAIPYGRECWRADGWCGAGGSSSDTVALGELVTRVNHAFRNGDERRQRSRGRHFYADLDQDTLHFSPHVPEREQLRRAVRTRAKPYLSKARPGRPSPDASTDFRWRIHQIELAGNTITASQSGPWHRCGNTAQRQLGGFVEHLYSTERGVERVWRLADKPEPLTDLVIRTRVEPARLVATTETGAHFGDVHGTARVRIGPAWLVEANGDRHPVGLETGPGGEVTYRVPAALLAAAEYPVVVDPIIEPEFGIDEPVAVDINADQYEPRIATIGSQSLVVWTDKRAGTPHIYGARVSSDGVALDPGGIEISSSSGESNHPHVASNGTDYAVVWEEWTGSESGVGAARMLGATGDVVGGQLAIGVADDTPATPAVASNGTDYLLVWAQGTPAKIHGVTLTAGGTLGTAAELFGQSGEALEPQVSLSGSEYLVVWADDRSGTRALYAGRVNGSGEVVSGSEQLVRASPTGSIHVPEVACVNSRCLMVWAEEQIGPGDYWTGQGIMTNAVAQPLGAPVTVANSAAVHTIRVGANDVTNDFVVIWAAPNSSRRIQSQRVSSTGHIYPVINLTDAGLYADKPDISQHGGEYVATWSAGPSFSSTARVDGQRLDATGAPVGDDFLVAHVTNGQYFPDVAARDGGYLIVWQDNRNDYGDIWGARVNLPAVPGDPLVLPDPEGLPISTALNNQGAPVVASDGTDFMVAWQDTSGPYWHTDIARVDADGTVTEFGPVVADSTDQVQPDIASNGSTYLVAWRQTVGSSLVFHAALVDSSGTLLEFQQLFDRPDVYSVGLTSDGDGYLAVGWTAGYSIIARLVDSAGMPVGASYFAVSDPARTDVSYPAASGNADGYVVTWSDRTPSWQWALYGRSVSSAGEVGPVNEIAFESDGRFYPGSMTSRAGGHVAVWGFYQYSGAQIDVHGAMLNADATISGGQLVLADTSDTESYPAVASAAADHQLVVYSRNMNDDEFSGYRVRVVEIKADTDGDGVPDVLDDDDDGDGISDTADNCPLVANPGQENADGDAFGDVCDPYTQDPDYDGDGLSGIEDNCPYDANPGQEDGDGDGAGDACDAAPADPNSHPGAVELCDGIDNDGNGSVDEDTGCEVCP